MLEDTAKQAFLDRTLTSLRGSAGVNAPSDTKALGAALASMLQFRGAAFAEGRLQCLQEVAKGYYLAGAATEGLAATAAGVHLAREIGSDAWERKLLTSHGILLGEVGDLSESCEAYSEALDICNRLGDPLANGTVWCNIATTFLNAGLLELSIKACEQACNLVSRCEKSRVRDTLTANALSTLSYCSLLTQRYGLGLRSAKRAIDERSSFSDHSADALLNQVLDERNFAWLLLRVGDYASALEHGQVAQFLSRHPNGGPRTHAIAESIVGLCETYTGSSHAGIQRIEQALAASAPLEYSFRIHFLYVLLEANDVAGRPADADKYRRELADATRELRLERLLQNHREPLGEVARGTLARHSMGITLPFPGVDRRQRSKRASEQPRDMLRELCGVAELHEDPSGKHAYRVGSLATLLVIRSLKDDGLAIQVGSAAQFHDIGKVAIPEDILRKRGKLSSAELATMRSHTTIGADILESASLGSLDMAIDVARHHHEFWNGTGYPDGLSGEQIPLAARVTAIADVFDALTHDRPYRPAITIDQALAAIVERSGHQFDPRFVGPFCETIIELRSQHRDLDEFLGRDAVELSAFLRALQRMSQRMDKTASIDKFLA